MSCLERFLAVVDGFLCLFVFFPLAIFHWRGTWGLQDVYFYPSSECISGWISLVFGLLGCIAMQLIQPCLFKYIPREKRKTYAIVSRLYLYSNGWFVMGYWRGVWDLFDYYLTAGWYNSVILYAFCQVFTLVTRTTRNNVGLPFSLALDTKEDILKPDTLLSYESSSALVYVLDILYCQLIIVTSNIIVWRGIWNVFDAFLFPDDLLLSDLISLGLGYLLCIQMFLLQWPAGITSEKLDDHHIIWKILFEDLIMLVATWANLLLWRGGWDLCVKYVIPDPMVGGWICHWLGTIGLGALQIFNSVAINGVEKDGDWEKGEGIFPTSYLRIIFADKLTAKKRHGAQYTYLKRDAADCDDVSSIYTDQDNFSDSGAAHYYNDDVCTVVDDVEVNTHNNGVSSLVSEGQVHSTKSSANGYTVLATSSSTLGKNESFI